VPPVGSVRNETGPYEPAQATGRDSEYPELDCRPPESLPEIRNIRNWTVGHPTKIDRYSTHSHHAIQRPQLGRGGFSLYSAFDDGREQYTYVPLVQMARLQRRVVSRLLRDMLRDLNAQPQATKKTAPMKQARPAVHITQPVSRKQSGRPKRGILPQKPPQFATARPVMRKAKKRTKRQGLRPALLPLPGEHFGRQSPAA